MKQPAPGTKTYKENQKRYEKYVNSITPSHSLLLNMAKAFLTGGLICAFGQLILNTAMTIGADRETAGNWCSLLLILSSVILTGLNLYSKIGKFGGAGSLVPITGFATPLQLPRSNTVQRDRFSVSAAKYLPLPVLSFSMGS